MIPIRTETSMNAGPVRNSSTQMGPKCNVSESQARTIFIIVAAKQNSAQGKRGKGRKDYIMFPFIYVNIRNALVNGVSKTTRCHSITMISFRDNYTLCYGNRYLFV